MGTLDRIHVSVCICTRNRPLELDKALQSLARSTIAIYETIVSDDSTNDDTEQLVRTRFPHVKYLSGPRKGIGANRNHAVKQVTGTHVLFIDDDVILDERFLEKMQAFMSSFPDEARSRMIVTGTERKHGEIVYPHDQDFLGFQRVNYRIMDQLKTVVINGTLFVSSIFKEIHFDEQLVYGCDEVDFSTRCCNQGYLIYFHEDAFNHHYPSTINRDYYNPYRDASRLYVTLKKYLYTENNYMKALIYIVLAPAHTILSSMKRHKLRGFAISWLTIKTASRYLFAHIRSRRYAGSRTHKQTES